MRLYDLHDTPLLFLSVLRSLWSSVVPLEQANQPFSTHSSMHIREHLVSPSRTRLEYPVQEKKMARHIISYREMNSWPKLNVASF